MINRHKIFIKSINKLIEIDEPLINVSFTDSVSYRNFVLNLENEIIYSINDVPTNFLVKTIIIFDPLHIDINEKKILTLLYKKMSSKLTFAAQEKVARIESEIIELLDELSMYNDFSIEYNESLDMQKLLSMYQVVIKQNKQDNYVEALLTYIKTYSELTNNNIVISFGITQLLTENELQQLKKELAIIQVCIVDFVLNKQNSEINYLTIDEDWNII